jgi:hypothetical protein
MTARIAASRVLRPISMIDSLITILPIQTLISMDSPGLISKKVLVASGLEPKWGQVQCSARNLEFQFSLQVSGLANRNGSVGIRTQTGSSPMHWKPCNARDASHVLRETIIHRRSKARSIIHFENEFRNTHARILLNIRRPEIVTKKQDSKTSNSNSQEQ